MVLQKNCYEFIAYENLIRQPSRRQSSSGRDRAGTPAAAPPPSTLTTAPVNKAFPLVTRALQLLVDREVTPQLGLLKSTLLQLDSTFSERDYGASSFRDFAEKLAQAGLVALRSAGRSVLVELKDTDEGNEAVEGAPVETEHVAAPASAVVASGEGEPQPSARADAPQPSMVDGIRLLQRVLATPGTIPRWPMYVRNVKQAMRAADPGFDERRHGNLVEILRSVQRDGLIRLDRDRQGVLRVFQGPQLRLPTVPTAEPVEGAAEFDLTVAPPAETGDAVIAGAATGAETADRTDTVTGDESPAISAQPVEPAEASGSTSPAAGSPRRRRKAGAAAPKATSTTARKPRARTTTPRKRKDTGTE
jgi:hypothetical protein